MMSRADGLIIGDILLFASTALSAAFLVSYIVLSRGGWWKTPVGRGIFFLMFALCIVLTTVSLSNVFGPEYFGRPLARVIAFSFVPVAIGNMLRLLYSLQIEGYRERYPKKYNLPR